MEKYLAYSARASDLADMWIFDKPYHEDKLYELHHAPELNGMTHNGVLVEDAVQKDRVQTTVDYILGLHEFQKVKFVEI